MPTTPPAPVWQVAQPDVIPEWLKVAPAKVVKLLWQLTQSPVVAIWFDGFETGVTPVKDCPVWQVVQPEVMPVWFIAPPAKLVKLVLWQTSQDWVVGRCAAGFPVTPPVPL